MPEIHLFERSTREARRLLGTGAPVFLLVDPQEYHGPHLPLANDALVAAGLARDIHARLAESHPDWPLLVTSDLGVGSGTVPHPASRSVPFREVRRLVVESCRALTALGAQRVVVMTFHGDPMHNVALQAGVTWLRRRGVPALAPMNAILRWLMAVTPAEAEAVLAHVGDPAERRAMAAEIHTDFHAGFGETSLTMYYAPEAVASDYQDVPPCPAITPERRLAAASRLAARLGRDSLAAELRFLSFAQGWFDLRPFPGYTGRPHLASAAAGAALAGILADRLATEAEAVLERGATPTPASLTWLEALSLSGRLFGGGLGTAREAVE